MQTQPNHSQPPIRRRSRTSAQHRVLRGRRPSQPQVALSTTLAAPAASIAALIQQWIDANPPQLYRGGA